jgi:hypothetical protein
MPNFRRLARHLAKGDIDFDTMTCKVLLVSSVPSEANLDAWEDRADVTNEITGTGYTAGGIAQPYTLDAFDETNNRQPITYADLPAGWTGATFGARGCIIYKDTGSAATDLLLHFEDFGSTINCTANNFNLTHATKFFINAEA